MSQCLLFLSTVTTFLVWLTRIASRGGNDAAIILPDVDIDKVAPQADMGAWWNSRQSCIAIKMIYIHESIYTDFLGALVAFTKTLRVSSTRDPARPRSALSKTACSSTCCEGSWRTVSKTSISLLWASRKVMIWCLRHLMRASSSLR